MLLLRELLREGVDVNASDNEGVTALMLASASADESVRLWNVYTSCCIAIFAGVCS